MQTGRWKFTAVTMPPTKNWRSLTARPDIAASTCTPPDFREIFSIWKRQYVYRGPQKTAQNSRLLWKIWDSLI
jgi:hypothetical protein